MTADPRDNEPSDGAGRSLVGRLVEAVRRWIARPRGARRTEAKRARWGRDAKVRPFAAVMVALLLAAGPMLTWGGAHILAAQARSTTADLAPRAAPIRAHLAGREAARTMLSRAATAPTVAALLDHIARVLPDDARLAHIARSDRGDVEFRVAAADPDRLREALRRDTMFAGLRDVEQRRGDAAMIVTYRGRLR